MSELTPRQRLILALVVREYTESAEPVGSKSLAVDYSLEFSSATIRNELAHLEELGLLTHPHTSAGRLPTEKGYRYFVKNLMTERELPISERLRIRHQFHQLGFELNQWLQLAAAVLADTVRNAALVTAPKALLARFKHLELISTYGNAVLMVVVLQDGTVRQQGFFTPGPMSQADLSVMSNYLSELCAGLSTVEINALMEKVAPLEREILDQITGLMAETNLPSTVEAYHEGLKHLLEQPEFASSFSAREAIRLVESNWLAVNVLPEVFMTDGVTVIIGGNAQIPDLGDYGLVISRYGIAQELFGTLGVIGPMRMQYEQVIPAVRYMAALLSDLLWSLFGPGESKQQLDQ